MSSTFAVGGLASGLDTTSIISQLMALEERPLNQVKARKTAHTSKMSAVQSIKDQISSLLSATKGLADRAKLNAKTASTDTPAGSPFVLFTSASADAINGSFKVTVSQLATSTRVTSTGPMGGVIDTNALLKNAGFRFSVAEGNFRINGQSIVVDGTTTVNSLIGSINSSGAGVTASLVADADGRANNRVQIIGAPGQALQMGSLSDTSNALRLLNLADAPVTGYTASSTNSGVAASAGALNTSITINGVTTNIVQGNGANTDVQNASFIADAINNNADNTVTAVAQGDGTITLTQKTLGSQQAIDVTSAGAGTGLAVALTKNGTDRIVSSTGLGMTDVGAPLASSRLTTAIAGYDMSGNGKFKINDVEITYKASDSITTILNRINASSAGVTASYDPIQDRIRFSASQTGARTMTLEDTQGNFLAATGVLGATQQLGQNAVFSIDTINNGAPITSATNNITGYVPGVTLDLKSTSATPVTVTVTQDTQTASTTVKTFVTQFNAALQKIEDLTKYDSETKKASALTGDSGIRDLQRKLRQMVSGSAIGATGAYTTLASIGISFGAVGSQLGSTSRLSVDESKLSKALTENPKAVEAVLSGFGATLGSPSTGTVVTSVSGTPQIHEDGEYRLKVTDAATGAVEVKFVASGGRTLWTANRTLTPGEDSFTVIPGLRVKVAGGLVDGNEDVISVSVTNKGIGVSLNDYVDNLLKVDGYFDERKSGEDAITKSYDRRIADINERLERKKLSLEKKYAALETSMAKLQSQSSALSSAIAKLNASTAPAS